MSELSPMFPPSSGNDRNNNDDGDGGVGMIIMWLSLWLFVDVDILINGYCVFVVVGICMDEV